MKKIFKLLLICGFLSSLLSAQDPDIFISLKPGGEECYWLVYREETFSEIYDKANGTIIPLGICKVDPRRGVCWGIHLLTRKNQQVKFDFCFRSDVLKEGRFSHNFFSKGDDRKLAPTVICSDDCFRIQIPEESGRVRNIVIQRGRDIESFKRRFKISPLMPVFTWEKITLFEM